MTLLGNRLITKTGWATIGLMTGFLAHGNCQALPASPIFFGLSSGVANVNWSAMIKHDLAGTDGWGLMDADNPTLAGGTNMSTGGFIGLQLTKFFAIQADYIHYPTTSILFEHEPHAFYPNKSVANNYTASGKSSINCWDIELRPSIHLWREKLSSFALVGLNIMQRSDPWAQAKYTISNVPDETPPPITSNYTNYNVGGTFGAGIDYNFDIPLSIEAGFTYTTGQARAAAAPMYYYFPFLYRSYISILYHF